ncbi:MAG: PqqD family protein [Candidatus Aminicenantes bacterium]|nr:PqqD family protein [Candidatus Aminicenantes bacterium]
MSDLNAKIYCLSEDYSLFKGDFKEKRFQLFNVKEGTIFKLNEVAYDMLSFFDGEKNAVEVVNELKKIYNIDAATLQEDFDKMLKSWIKKNFLIERS